MVNVTSTRMHTDDTCMVCALANAQFYAFVSIREVMTWHTKFLKEQRLCLRRCDWWCLAESSLTWHSRPLGTPVWGYLDAINWCA